MHHAESGESEVNGGRNNESLPLPQLFRNYSNQFPSCFIFTIFFFFFKLLWGATPEWRRTKYIVCLSKTISLVSFKVSNLIRAQQTEPGPDESAVLHNHRLPCSIQSSHIHLQYTVYHLCDAPHLLNILSLKIWTAVHAFDIQMHASHVLYILWSKSKMRFFFPFFALH